MMRERFGSSFKDSSDDYVNLQINKITYPIFTVPAYVRLLVSLVSLMASRMVSLRVSVRMTLNIPLVAVDPVKLWTLHHLPALPVLEPVPRLTLWPRRSGP